MQSKGPFIYILYYNSNLLPENGWLHNPYVYTFIESEYYSIQIIFRKRLKVHLSRALVGPVYFTVAILGYWPETRSFSSDANFGSVASRLDTSNGSRILGYYMRFSHILIKCFSRLANVMMPPISSLTME